MFYTIGFDQSYSSSGFCVIDDAGTMVKFGTIKTKKDIDGDIFDRALKISDALEQLIANYDPRSIALEGLAYGMTGNATRDLAGLQFIIITMLRRKYCNIKLAILSPNAIKKFATDNGKAKKEEMVAALPQNILDQIVEKNFKKTTGLYDITDAYFIAQFALNQTKD